MNETIALIALLLVIFTIIVIVKALNHRPLLAALLMQSLTVAYSGLIFYLFKG